MSGPMKRAREIVERHSREHGEVPKAHLLAAVIAADLGFVELSAIPHRETVDELLTELRVVSTILADMVLCGAAKTVPDGAPGYFIGEDLLPQISATIAKAEGRP